MGTWHDLPTELAILIFSSLEYHTNNLIQCTYVSRQIRAIVELLIYRDVEIKGETYDVSYKKLYHFIRTIVCRPELGDLVHDLAIPDIRDPTDSYIIEEDFTRSCNSNLTPEEVSAIRCREAANDRTDMDIFLNAATRLGLPNGLTLIGGGVGKLILLFHHLGRLKKLQLRIGLTETFSMRLVAYSALGTFTGGVPLGLQSLSELSMVYRAGEVNMRSWRKEQGLN